MPKWDVRHGSREEAMQGMDLRRSLHAEPKFGPKTGAKG